MIPLDLHFLENCFQVAILLTLGEGYLPLRHWSLRWMISHPPLNFADQKGIALLAKRRRVAARFLGDIVLRDWRFLWHPFWVSMRKSVKRTPERVLSGYRGIAIILRRGSQEHSPLRIFAR